MFNFCEIEFKLYYFVFNFEFLVLFRISNYQIDERRMVVFIMERSVSIYSVIIACTRLTSQ